MVDNPYHADPIVAEVVQRPAVAKTPRRTNWLAFFVLVTMGTYGLLYAALSFLTGDAAVRAASLCFWEMVIIVLAVFITTRR